MLRQELNHLGGFESLKRLGLDEKTFQFLVIGISLILRKLLLYEG